MLNDLFENKRLKRISHEYTFFYKNIFPFFVGFISLIAILISIIGKDYLPLILFSPFILGITIAFIIAYKMKIADEVYLDYKNREFNFLYKKRDKRIRKSFTDITSVRKMAMGQTIKLVFNGDEKYFFYSKQKLFSALPSNSVYREIKFILDNRMGQFLTEQEEIT